MKQKIIHRDSYTHLGGLEVVIIARLEAINYTAMRYSRPYSN